MILKRSNIRLLLLLFYKASIIIAFKFKIDDKYQPFMVNIQYDSDIPKKDRQYLFSALPPSSSNNKEIEYVSVASTSSTNLLISTCPSENSNSGFAPILYQNESVKTKSCSQTFRPSMYHINENLTYGVKQDGVKYSVGYWVSWNGKSAFVPIHHIFYSNQDGLLYTTHIIFPGTEITLNKWINDNGTTLLQSPLVDYPIEYEESMIQLVPFEDLIPMPWKMGTLFNINFITVDGFIKHGFDVINESLRNHVNNTNSPLTVFSGVMNNVWYWKVAGVGDQAVMICIMSSDAGNQPPPCEVGGCEQFGLSTLPDQVSNVYCCEVTQQISRMLNLVSYGIDRQPDYMTFDRKLELSPSLSPNKKTLKKKLSFSLSKKNVF